MDDLLTPTTFWLTLGLLLMALELASGAAVLIFCGLGALAVGTLLAAGVPLPTPWQIVLAAALALAATLGLRLSDRSGLVAFMHGIHGSVCGTAQEYVEFFQSAVATIDQACDDYVPPG